MNNRQTKGDYILGSLDSKKLQKNLEYLNKNKKGERDERRKQRKGDSGFSPYPG